MPRKGPAPRRDILPDPKYRDLVVTKFVNMMMDGGKKGTAERILYGALDILGKRTGEESVETFRRALENVKPIVEVRSRRVGGATYQVPIEVRTNRRNSLAMRWLVKLHDHDRRRICERNWPVNFLRRLRTAGERSRNARIHTAWLRPTRHLLTTAGKW